MSIKILQFYIKDTTLMNMLKEGLLYKYIQNLEKRGVMVRLVALALDPVGEPGYIFIGHERPEEAERGGLRISIDPRISDKVVEAVIEALKETFQPSS